MADGDQSPKTPSSSNPHGLLLESQLETMSPLEKFTAIAEGRTKLKPKLLDHPDTGALFRLVSPKNGPAYYEEVRHEPQVSYGLALRDSEKARYEAAPPALPDSFAVRSFKFNLSEPPEFPDIHLKHIHAIISALGRAYNWSTTEESWRAGHKPYIANILFEDDHIIGICIWEKPAPSTDAPEAFIHTFMMDNAKRGGGLGKHLFDYSMHQIVTMASKAQITLSTSNLCTDKSGKCVTDFYERNGFEIRTTGEFNEALYRQATLGTQTQSVSIPPIVPAGFFLDPTLGEDLPRFSSDRLRTQLDRVAQQLLSQSVNRHSGR